MNAFFIKHIGVWPVDLPLKASVVVANGARDMAENIFVGVTLYDGSVGYGEVAPFPEITGAGQGGSFAAFPIAVQVDRLKSEGFGIPS